MEILVIMPAKNESKTMVNVSESGSIENIYLESIMLPRGIKNAIKN